jgi:ATP-binding cassette subfamily B protein
MSETIPQRLSSRVRATHYLSLLRRTWHYGRGKRGTFVLVCGMFVMANLLLMLEPFVLGLVLNTLQVGGPRMLHDAVMELSLFCGLTFGFWIFHGPARILERSFSFHAYRNFQEDTYGLVTRLPLQWHREHHSGATIDKMQKAAGALRSFNDEHYNYIETIVRFVASLTAIVLITPLYGMLAIGGGLVIATLILRFNARIVGTVREVNALEHGVNAMLYDYLGNIFTVVTLRLQDLTKREWMQKIGYVFPVFRRNIILNELKWGIVSVFLSLLNFALLALYIWQHAEAGVVLVGSLMTLYQYLGRFIDVFFRISSQLEKLLWADTNLALMDPIVALGASLPPPADAVARPWHRIRVERLRFSYEDAHHEKHHLQDMRVEMRRGLKIAFVGESGSGKSTFLALLRGLEEPESVELWLDDERHESLAPLSGITTLIPQNPEIFDNTLEYNVTAGIPYPPEEVAEACRISRLDAVLEELPQGLATPVKERGANLSGGQKQRLALARALLSARGSSVLLLDEPTSSIDPLNEVRIYRGIFGAFGDACVISAIHRLHLLTLFDEVYVLDHGLLVEHGPVRELLGRPDGRLRVMWEKYEKELAHEG